MPEIFIRAFYTSRADIISFALSQRLVNIVGLISQSPYPSPVVGNRQSSTLKI
jgi:hypothetical protein